jgi:hypothetical protein
MKNIYILSAHDSSTDSFVATQHYSNLSAATGSFQELKNHLINKYNLDSNDVDRWTFSHGGAHQTEILSKRFNITLVKYNVSKETSKFL